LRRHWSKAAESTRGKFSELAGGVVASLLRSMKTAVSAGDDDGSDNDDDGGDDGAGADSTSRRRNAFKMLVFLCAEAAQVSAAMESDAAASGDKAPRGKGRAQASKGAAMLETLLDTMATAARSDFVRLWPLGVVEEVCAHLLWLCMWLCT
jgi:hypothetical protein